MGYRQGDEIGSPVKPLVARRVTDVQKDYWNESVAGMIPTATGLTCVPSYMSLPDLLSDNQFPVFLRLTADLCLVDIIVRVFDCVFVSLELFEKLTIFLQSPFECSLAGDPAIIPKRNNKVSNGFDQCNVVGLQERIDFELQGNMDCEVAYHEDDGVPAN